MPEHNPGRPFSELRDHGLLWLINRTVFHPRGYAMALHFENDDPENLGECTGWSMLGDGTEPWRYGDDPDGWTEDSVFAGVEAFLASLGSPDASTGGN